MIKESIEEYVNKAHDHTTTKGKFNYLYDTLKIWTKVLESHTDNFDNIQKCFDEIHKTIELMREMNESLSKRIEFLERQGEQDGYRN
jgi:Ni,Fe-hydrogenase III large subunit